MKTPILLAALVLLIGVVLSGCAGKQAPAATPTPVPTTGGGNLQVDNLGISIPDLETPSVGGDTGFENADVDV